MSETSTIPNTNITLDNHENSNKNGINTIQEGAPVHFARRRWSAAVALAEQLRNNTQLKRNEQLRKCAFQIPLSDGQETNIIASFDTQYERINAFQQQLLFAKRGRFPLDTLTESFVNLKRIFDRMFDISKNELQQIKLATMITKTALLIILRSTESVVSTVTKGTVNFPKLSSIISYVRTRHKEFPIDGRLLVDWYKAAQILDLLIDDPDWLVQPRKTYWAMHTCNETLAWSCVVFSEKYCTTARDRPIFDRDDSVHFSESKD